jgi:hypothetical protein
MTMRPTSSREARAAGLVMVGKWGWGHTLPGSAGGIWCRPEDRDGVQAAYDAIEDGDLGPDVLDGVMDAGGVFVADE